MDLILTPNTSLARAAAYSPGLLRVARATSGGRFFRRKGALSPDATWIWAVTGVFDGLDAMRRSGMPAAIEEAQAAVKENWDRWMTSASLSESGATIDRA
jgi:hypothetical protein